MNGWEAVRGIFNSLVILAIFWALAKSTSYSLAGWVAKLAKKTETTWDDRVVGVMRSPSYYFIFLLGGYLAAKGLPFGGLIRDTLAGVMFLACITAGVYLLVAVFQETFAWYSAHMEGKIDKEFLSSLANFARALIIGTVIISGIIIALNHFGKDLIILDIILIGGYSVIGWALKDHALNISAGVILAMLCPFSAGDEVELTDGKKGTVEGLGILYTMIRSGEARAFVPNSRFLSETFICHSGKKKK